MVDIIVQVESINNAKLLAQTKHLRCEMERSQ
jgi:hypothetical protein